MQMTPHAPISRSNRTIFGFVLLLLIGLALFEFSPGLRASLLAIPGNVSDIPLRVLALVVVLKAAQSLLSALAWRNVLCSSFPDNPPEYRLVLGLDQGKEAINVVSPAKIGSWVMLSGLRISIPGAQMPTLMAAWGAHSLAYAGFALFNSVLLGLTLPSVVGARPSLNLRQFSMLTGHPLLIGAVALAVLVLVALLARRFLPRVAHLKQELVAGVAILGSPGRYLSHVFLPSLLSYLCRIAIFGVIMASFGIKLTVVTLILALAAHAVAGVIRFTPAGFGTTQAIDVIVLHAFASTATITAYSLTQGMLMTTLSLVLGSAALLWALGWSGAKQFAFSRPQAAIRTR